MSDGYNSIEVISAVVTGTHSSGKSTLVNDFMQTLDNVRSIGGESQGALYTYETGSISIGNTVVPVVAAPEAATLYAQDLGKPEVLTSRYSLGHQIRIELLADTLGTEASLLSEVQFNSLNQGPQDKRIAILLCDRTGLDGAVYSRSRVPEAEQEQINLDKVMESTGGILVGPTPHVYFWRQCVREAVARSDVIFIANHAEVPFESSDLRLEDQEFREQIGRDIATSYTDLIGVDKILHVSGSRQERVQFVRAHIQTLATKALL